MECTRDVLKSDCYALSIFNIQLVVMGHKRSDLDIGAIEAACINDTLDSI
ncbi:hypothetical protein NFD58_12595 [Staphylococcus epidermidis]|nr:hypothetical protein [Staphylococcus epidermidis]